MRVSGPMVTAVAAALLGDLPAPRQVRFARLAHLFTGDRAGVYAREGFPMYRERVRVFGEVTESWTYPERHVRYFFRGDRLLRVESY